MTNFDIYYDGDCPVCSRYVLMSRLKKEFDVRLLNLREHPEKVQEFSDAGYNVDDGMMVELEGQRYFGADAMYIMNVYGDGKGPLAWLMEGYFKHQKLAQVTYPLLRFGRNSLLRMLGRKKIMEN